MTCAELMTQRVASCSENERVDLAAKLMRDRNIGALPVVGADNRPVGIITDRDLAVGIVAKAEDSYYIRVNEVMHAPVFCCGESDDVIVALEAMTRHRIRRVPVVDREGRLVGIITVDDLARSLDAETMGPLLAGLSVAGTLTPST